MNRRYLRHETAALLHHSATSRKPLRSTNPRDRASRGAKRTFPILESKKKGMGRIGKKSNKLQMGDRIKNDQKRSI